MPIQKSDYETLLSEYSNPPQAIALLKQYRPYLEMIPSMRRPLESLIPIPLPVVRIRHSISKLGNSSPIVAENETICLPCDLVVIMCDPEWKIKMGVEICIFIHRPQEDFSDLLLRWRQTQVLLDKNYEWLMPHRYQHIFSEKAEQIYPLFVLFAETPARIRQGLLGASLPCVTQNTVEIVEEQNLESFSPKNPPFPIP